MIVQSSSCLCGKFLIAMPGLDTPYFRKAVIYVCSHNEEGSMGLIVSHVLNDVTFYDFLGNMGEVTRDARMRALLSQESLSFHVQFGGPVEPYRGFVLHSPDYLEETTMIIDHEIALTSTVDIVKAIAKEKGPKSMMVALGYTGWASGQLEAEIQANGWLHCDADPDLVFKQNLENKWESALGNMGVDPAMLSRDTGHA